MTTDVGQLGYRPACVETTRRTLFCHRAMVWNLAWMSRVFMRAVKGRWWDKLKAKLPPVDGQSAQTMSVVRSVPDECHDGFKLLTYFRWFAPTDSDMRKSF